ncbi:MAG TPA: carbonate dehydratase [Chthoniobacterales bacterium]
MSDIELLFKNNAAWAAEMVRRDPGFFARLSQQQSPKFLWIGCADSRVPANEIVGLEPGELFVHRNVANVVVHADLNCLSVIQFAVDVLKVRHIIVTGHYGCGGVLAALNGRRVGLADNWLRHVQDVRLKHQEVLEEADCGCRGDLLCELNVVEQVVNVCQTTVVQDAWDRGQEVSVHGFVYGISDGILHDLEVSISSSEELGSAYHQALAKLG